MSKLKGDKVVEQRWAVLCWYPAPVKFLASDKGGVWNSDVRADASSLARMMREDGVTKCKVVRVEIREL